MLYSSFIKLILFHALSFHCCSLNCIGLSLLSLLVLCSRSLIDHVLCLHLVFSKLSKCFSNRSGVRSSEQVFKLDIVNKPSLNKRKQQCVSSLDALFFCF